MRRIYLRAFSLIEIVIYIGLLSFLVQLMTNIEYNLKDTLARTQTMSVLEDERLLIFDNIQTAQPIPGNVFASIEKLSTSSEEYPSAIDVDLMLSATTSRGQTISTKTHRTTWGNI